LPIVFVSYINTKQFFAFLEKILGEFFNVALKHKKQRAGKGKARNGKPPPSVPPDPVDHVGPMMSSPYC